MTNEDFTLSNVCIDLNNLSIKLYGEADQQTRDYIGQYNNDWIQQYRTDSTCIAAELDKLETFFPEYFEEGIKMVIAEFPQLA